MHFGSYCDLRQCFRERCFVHTNADTSKQRRKSGKAPVEARTLSREGIMQKHTSLEACQVVCTETDSIECRQAKSKFEQASKAKYVRWRESKHAMLIQTREPCMAHTHKQGSTSSAS